MAWQVVRKESERLHPVSGKDHIRHADALREKSKYPDGEKLDIGFFPRDLSPEAAGYRPRPTDEGEPTGKPSKFGYDHRVRPDLR